MSAEQLISYLTWAVFFSLFALVAFEAIRHPQRINVTIALLFAAPALVIAIGVAALFGLVTPGPLPNAINSVLVLAIPYLTLRLLREFTSVPFWLYGGAGVAYLLLAIGSFAIAPPRPPLFTILQLLYFAGIEAYAGVAFARESFQTSGVTRRRLRTVALGTILLGLAVVASSMRQFGPLAIALFQLCALGSGICYFFGFTPPGRVRRSWQEPELRAFLKTTAELPRLPDVGTVVRAIERGAAASVGVPVARLGLWDEREQVLRFLGNGVPHALPPEQTSAAGRAFLGQRSVFAADDSGEPALSAHYASAVRQWAVMAAPVTSAGRRHGVLTVYAPREAIFSADDLDIVELIATQSATVLESRTLIDELARVAARQQAARLKDDFLSAAAHDLKTPLTTLVARSQMLQRRMHRSPDTPVDARSIDLIVQEAERLRALVLELLDAGRADQARLLGARVPLDLGDLAREVRDRYSSARHPLEATIEPPLGYVGDRARLGQAITSLVDNAIKFSPNGGTITITVRCEAEQLRLSVADRGIGIPPGDLELIFDRFSRASNVDDRSFAGMGLGLYIARAIIEQHGGRVWAESQLGQGSTFHLTLPLAAEGADHGPAAADDPGGR